ncbi:MAG: tRNA pseudouridine(55) synthase TruB, partial [Coriobacteriia bacterium]|nr:tRNA pseudouridine(55) synthase TruB [Coriobacteriia bacterium]
MRASRGASGLNGIVLIDKPAGITSHDVVDALRRMTGEKRIGHAGTLDPAATGLLIMMIGKATKLSDQLMASHKTYRATITFGSATDTDDADGEVISLCEVDRSLFDQTHARDIVSSLVGTHKQIPPDFSAIKVNGTTSYRAARKGEALEHKPRSFTISEARLISIDPDANSWTIEVEVSKGTYIRALARDLGTTLGSCAHLSALRRLSIGDFSVDDAYDLEFLRAHVERPYELARYFTPFSGTGPRREDVDVVIGAFDGLHLGHQALIEQCVDLAHNEGRATVMVTFDQLPEVMLHPHLRSYQLYPLE